MKNILFLCTGNSCRSQMAEGFAKNILGKDFKIYSAGIAPSSVDPLSVQVMKEVNIDISMHRSKKLSDIEDIDFDYVITLCDHAKETCPFFPANVQVLHKSFQDPPEMGEGIEGYRKVREEIRKYILKLKEDLNF